ncbi:hypothetical protein AB0E55_41585, partial [Amycolatopsis keratiniphila]|uniref:hypothetical protein n=1 Tax=Amycolatopsis keratiniphila TaxID=129921 RepID=UPI0033FFD08C
DLPKSDLAAAAALVPSWVTDFRPGRGLEPFPDLLSLLRARKDDLPLAIALERLEKGKYPQPTMIWVRSWFQAMQEESVRLTGRLVPPVMIPLMSGGMVSTTTAARWGADLERPSLDEALSLVPDWVTGWRPDPSPGSSGTLMDFLAVHESRLPFTVSLVPGAQGLVPEATSIWIRAWVLDMLREVGRAGHEELREIRRLVSAGPFRGTLPDGTGVFSVPESLSLPHRGTSAVPDALRDEAQEAMLRGRADSRAHLSERSDHDTEMEDAPPMTETADSPMPDAPPVREEVRDLDQGRREVVFHRDGQDTDLQMTRVVEHALRWEPELGMDYRFPWRDAADPVNRVFEPFADDAGRVHPAVLAGLDQVTAKMAGSKQLLKSMAASPEYPHLTGMSSKDMQELWPRLERDVAEMVKSLALEDPERGPEPGAVPLRMEEEHLPEHERVFLVGKWGLRLAKAPAELAPEERMSVRNGRVVGLYLGAVLTNEATARTWQETYRLYPSYHMDLTSWVGYTMTAEGAANAIAFANTALMNGEIDYDQSRINAIFVPFEVRIPDKTGKLKKMMISAMVALDNAFDPVGNPYGILTVDYGPLYLDLFRDMNIIKPEPEE